MLKYNKNKKGYGDCMKKHKKIIIVLVVLIVIIGILYKFNDIIVPLIIQNEKVGMYEINKMQECKNLEERNFTIDVDNTKITLPLPKGAVEFKNDIYPNKNQFLISTKNENIINYIEEILPANNFTATQYGAMVAIKDNENNINIDMFMEMYTTNFMRLNFSVNNIQESKDNFTKTYNVLNIAESDDENYLYLTIKQFQHDEVETVKVLKSIANSVETNKNYEFTFQYENKNIEDNIKSIFENATLVQIKETDKTGLEQIQDTI